MKKPIGKLKKGDIFKFNDVHMVEKKYRDDDHPLVTHTGQFFHNDELLVEVLPVLKGRVLMNDPDSDDEDLAGIVTVRLDNGHSFDFWLLGKTETEYLRLSSLMFYIENKENENTK